MRCPHFGRQPMAEYLTRRRATAYLRANGITVADSYLGCAACDGFGPQFRYLGKHPVYLKADLDAWIKIRKGSRLDAFLWVQGKRLRLGPPTRSTRKNRRRKQSNSDLAVGGSP